MRMKRKNTLIYLMIILVGVVSIHFLVSEVEATGGQVRTGGKVLFYEETIDSSTGTSSDSTTPSSDPTSPGEPVQKPVGRVPSLGESINHYLVIGIGLLLFFLLLFLRKNRKEEK